MTRRLITVALTAILVAGCTSADGEPVASGAEGRSTSTSSAAQPTTSAPNTSAPNTRAPNTSAPNTTVPVATTIVVPPGPLFGIAVPEARLETIEAIEAEVGHRLHLIRVFLRWDDVIADTDVGAIQADGRAVHLSVRPVRSDGSPIPWKAIAAAEPGSSLYDEMIAWADAVVALGPDLRFTFNHEPETYESQPNGDALDYRAAWRAMVELIRARGGEDTSMVWTVGVDVMSSANGERWYPGDDVVDVIGADLYNWFTCQGTDRPWSSFESLIRPAVVFAEERGKPLALPEFASAADPVDDTRRAGWMDAAVDHLLELSDDGVDLDFVAWFDVTAPGGTYPDCRWSHTTDDETKRAFSRMVRDLVGPRA